MASIIPTFEYDIFISYRQKDNRQDGWVTQFVDALKKELDATFKEDISIYFDENPHDGLLETHDVDNSLKEKLRCVIFIPILSQTYCDPKSFAWNNEFLAFSSQAAHDSLGLKVKLPNGNVASRILPVCIHELDEPDRKTVEARLGGPIRGIEFIYKTPGVARSLKANENDPKANQNHTYYQDQVNKMARAIKDIITGIQQGAVHPSNPVAPEAKPMVDPSSRKKLSLLAAAFLVLCVLGYAWFHFSGTDESAFVERQKSIAVLPFENMSRDSTQDYFSDGIAEDILNHLTKITDLEVKSRTSTLQYKGTTKTAPAIGEELGVANIVEGSVRRVGNTVRVVVQLIDAKNDKHIWSETYDRKLKDVLAIQSEIAISIAEALHTKLSANEKNNIEAQASADVTAYDYYLKAREIVNRTNFLKADLDNALLLLNQSIRLDPGYAQAYALKGKIWSNLSSFGYSQKTWVDSAIFFASKSVELNPYLAEAYLVRGRVYRLMGKKKEEKKEYETAFQISPNDPLALFRYGSQLLEEGKEKGAELILRRYETEYTLKDPQYYLQWSSIYRIIGDTATQKKLILKAKILDPGSIYPLLNLFSFYTDIGNYSKALMYIEMAEKINPSYQGIIDRLAWLHYRNGNKEKALLYWKRYPEIEASFEDPTQTIPFRSRVAMVLRELGKTRKADSLIQEDLKINHELIERKRGMGTWDAYGSQFYTLADNYAYFKEDDKAIQYLDSLMHYHPTGYFVWGWNHDPLFSNLRKRKDFQQLLKKVNDHQEFEKHAFTNALNRLEESKKKNHLLER